MKNRAPAFQTYAAEARGRTFGLTCAAAGAIHRIELAMWEDAPDYCSIADDDVLLARTVGVPVAEWQQLRAEIQLDSKKYFIEREGRFVSPYLQREAARQRKFRKLQSEKGKRSAEQRLNRGSTAVEPEGQPEINSSSPTSTPTPTQKKTEEGKAHFGVSVNGNGHGRLPRAGFEHLDYTKGLEQWPH